MFRESISGYSTDSFISIEDLWDSVREILQNMTLDDKVCRCAASDYKQFQMTQNYMEEDTHNKNDKEA